MHTPSGEIVVAVVGRVGAVLSVGRRDEGTAERGRAVDRRAGRSRRTDRYRPADQPQPYELRAVRTHARRRRKRHDLDAAGRHRRPTAHRSERVVGKHRRRLPGRRAAVLRDRAVPSAERAGQLTTVQAASAMPEHRAGAAGIRTVHSTVATTTWRASITRRTAARIVICFPVRLTHTSLPGISPRNAYTAIRSARSQPK